MKIYHVERDFSKTLSEQKEELKKKHKNFQYLTSNGKKITFIAE